MQDHHTYDYAIIRIVPKVEREEFINAGIILSCPDKDFLEAIIEVDEERLKVLDPKMDIEAMKAYLSAIPAICHGVEESGPIGKLSKRERFHWLVSPRSTIVQTSPVHTGYCSEPQETMQHLMDTMVRK